jgi:biotin carboxylase
MPDLVVAYASDPAAPVAAYVSDQLSLPGNSYQSVRLLSEKDLFRQFQRRHGFNTPEHVLITDDNATEKLKGFRFPLMVKPTDSSGSKGVTKVSGPEGIAAAVRAALAFSRKKRVIAEEFIDNTVADIHGDGFVVNGELVFCFLGDHLYDKGPNPYNPIGTLWPSRHPREIVGIIENDVAAIVKESGFKNGSLNIEARVDSRGAHYVMEIGPRSGGHYVPQAIQYATGFDMVKASLDVLLGLPVTLPTQASTYSAYYAIHSDSDGILVHLAIRDELKHHLKEFHQYILPGNTVSAFRGANAAIGILVMTFDSREEMEAVISNMPQYINLKIDAA